MFFSSLIYAERSWCGPALTFSNLQICTGANKVSALGGALVLKDSSEIWCNNGLSESFISSIIYEQGTL